MAVTEEDIEAAFWKFDSLRNAQLDAPSERDAFKRAVRLMVYRCPSTTCSGEHCINPRGHDGAHCSASCIPGTCSTVWVDVPMRTAAKHLDSLDEALVHRAEVNAAQRDALAAHVRALLGLFDDRAYMAPEDQDKLWAARAALEEVSR